VEVEKIKNIKQEQCGQKVKEIDIEIEQNKQGINNINLYTQ
jgi:hypothetical protein